MSRLLLLIAAFAVALGTTGFDAAQTSPGVDAKTIAAGLHGLSLHDRCTADYPPQPDTCLHQQLLERSVRKISWRRSPWRPAPRSRCA